MSKIEWLKDRAATLPIELSIVLPVNLCVLWLLLFLGSSEYATASVDSHLSWYASLAALLSLVYVMLFVCGLLVPTLQTNTKRHGFLYNTVRYFASWSSFAVLVASYLLLVGVVYLSSNIEYTGLMTLWHLELDVFFRVPELLQAILTYCSWPQLFDYISHVYTNLVIIVLLFILFFSFVSTRLARQYVLSLYLSALVSIPLWLLFPTIAPLQATITDSFSEFSRHEELLIATAPYTEVFNSFTDTAWNEHTNFFVSSWDGLVQDGFGYTISNNPSMHVIWCVLLFVYLSRLHRLLSVYATFLLAGGVIGTVYFMQHYLIDLVTGALVAWGTVKLVDRLYARAEQSGRVDIQFWFSTILFLERLRVRVSAGLCQLVERAVRK